MPPGRTVRALLLAAACALAASAISVVPYESGCSGTSLHWWLLEPLARALGVHGAFRDGGALAGVVPWVPAGVVALGVVTGSVGLRALRRRRDGPPASAAPGLATLGAGATAVLSGAWGLWWSLSV